MPKYEPKVIEKKWQKAWEKAKLYATPDPSNVRPKKYVLDMFPYPSGAGLHVGHMEGYVATDVLSRYLCMKGFSVLHPMGWDAFGLPAENYAIKEGVPPAESTHKNIQNFRKQLKLLGLSYDWDREIDVSSPDYYKWTQWLFILLFKKGLAYKKMAPANWCPKDETVLANEQVVDGRCERCGADVVQKDLEQWFFKITAYADELIKGLDKVDWPKSTKVQQINWIGRKEGINIHYEIAHPGAIKKVRPFQDRQDEENSIEVFTTRPDTNFGATFVVLAPEHPLVNKITTKEQKKAVVDYVAKASSKKELERIAEGRKKTGVFTGAYAINPLNNYQMPIWVSDFVLKTVGTGALVGVPGHDKRDFEFANQFALEIKRVVVGQDGDKSEITKLEQVQGEQGQMVNSEFLDGLDIHEATKKMIDHLETKGWGKKVVTYHIRDWLISRQRYWGCPIPMIHCVKDGWQPILDTDLPVMLPTDVDFLPHGQSPIATSKTFQQGVKCPNCGGVAKREVDTMDTFVDSSWYFYRFTDPNNDQEFASKEALKTWMPVDKYVGGGHEVQHLLFARFFHKVLVDAGFLPNDGIKEPFLFLRAPGWILGPDARKMSKRWGNIITPEDVVAKHGADTMRVYEMFMAPFEVDKPWNVDSAAGVERFLAKIYVMYQDLKHLNTKPARPELFELLNKTVVKVGNDIEAMKFNTAISAMMEFYREIAVGLPSETEKDAPLRSLGEVWEKFLLILAPFAPHLAEELWHDLKGEKAGSIHKHSWPEVKLAKTSRESQIIVVTINSKPRGTLEILNPKSEIRNEELVALANKEERVKTALAGKTVKKVIYIPGKILNLVVE